MERSYADRADSATDFDPEMQFDKDIEALLRPCGECHLQQGERCDICGKTALKED